MERIELIHVNKKLGGKEVLKGVDLTLVEGKLYGIIGEKREVVRQCCCVCWRD